MNLRKLRALVPLAIVGLVFTACNKDKPDFSKYDDFDLNPAVVAKIVDTEITLENLADSIDAMSADSNGYLQIHYGQDTLFSQRIDSLLPPVSQSGSSVSVQLDGIEAPSVATNQTVALHDFFGSLDPDAVDSLRAKHNTVDYFPEIPPTVGQTIESSAGNDFNYINCSQGDMKLVIENQWSVDLDNLQMEMRNKIDQSVIGSFTFPSLPAGAKDSITVSLAGKKLENNLEVEIQNVESPGSGTDPFDTASHVLIDTNMSLLIDFVMDNIEITDGEIAIPNSTLPTEETAVVLDVNNGVELASVEFASGSFDISVDRDLNTDINFNLSIPAALDGQGNPFQVAMAIPAGSSPFNQTIDMTGVVFDMTQADTLPYNAIEIQYDVEVVGTSSPVYVNTASQITMNYGLQNLTFGLREGFFGDTLFDFADFSVEFPTSELLDRLGGVFTLNEPTFIMNFESSAGIPLGLNLDLIGKKNTGETETVTVNNFTIDAPTVQGSSVSSQLVIDAANYPNIVDLIAMFPDSVLGSANIKLNPAGVTHSNFLLPNSTLTVGFEMSVPLNVTAEDLEFRDLFGFGGIGLDPDTVDLEYLRLLLDMENEFPFDAELDLVLFAIDANDSLVPIDTLSTTALSAAPVDANGVVLSPVNVTETIEFLEEDMNKFQSADSISVNARLSSYDNGPVKIYEDYKIHLIIRAETKVKVNSSVITP